MRIFVPAAALAAGSPLPQGDIAAKFQEFETAFGAKEYFSSAERKRRIYTVFARNLATIAALQSQNAHAEFTHLTPWADLSPEEFQAMHGYPTPSTPANTPCQWETPGPQLEPTAAALDSIDYEASKQTAPVKDQGKCGSCWAHATTGRYPLTNSLNIMCISLGVPDALRRGWDERGLQRTWT